MRKMKFIASLLLLLAGTALFAAETGTIVGKITGEDKLSLAGANVFIREMNIGTATDQNGEFRLSLVPVGEHEITVSYIGYKTKNIKTVVLKDQIHEVNSVMQAGVLVGSEVLVVGERLQGQAKALNQQKTNANITNVVSADQIGRFPDSNVGDALKRIPAISVNYDQGEARFVNIRGTEPRLNSVMINGERVPSAEAEIRSVQVDLIPAEAIQTIEVHKAVTPDMDADAIGGSVNLITRGAPNDLRISGTLGSGYNFLSEKPMMVGSFVLANRFLDNKLGVVASASYHDHKLGSDNTEGSWDDFDGVISPEEWEVREYQLRRLRKSFTTALDYRLAPTHTLYLKGIYNHRNDWENRYRLRIRDISEPDENGIVSVETLVRQTKAGLDNDENDNARLEDQRTSSFQLSGDHLFAKKFKFNWSTSYAKASEERPNERYIGWELNAEDNPILFRMDGSNLENPYFTPVNASDVALSNFELDELTEEYQFTEEIDLASRFDLSFPLTETGLYSNSLKFGAKYRIKDKERDNNFFEYSPVEGIEVFSDLASDDQTNPDFLAGDYEIGRFTTKEALGQLDLNNSALFEKEDAPGEYAADNYTATEKVTAGYIQLNQRLGEKLSVIAGVRVEQTKVDYEGNEFIEEDADGNENIVSPTIGNDDYTNILPGLHATYKFDDLTNIRFAWTNTIARPSYYDLVPFRNIGGITEELEIGNPALEPTTSMNFDLMAEHYFEIVGILSAGLFYKDLSDFIYVYAEDDYVDPVSGQTYDEFFQPRNGASASLLGFEFAVQRRLDFLTSVLNNVNFYSNYTFTSSSADNPNLNDQVEGNEDIDLPGTAPHTLNTALTYDDGQLVLGLSFNYTSAYIDPDEMDLTPGLERYYDSVRYLDLNGSYAFTKQIRFYFEANNLLNQPLRYYAGKSNRTYQAEYYNRRMSAGMKFDF
ncbi:MAG: TonB-dependent receptor [Calditrichaeota bacterium]|nr:MAG: TonB-dependent receptor [Calditrichota bacterium]